MQTVDYIISYIDFTQREIIELYEKTTGIKYVNDKNSSYIDLTLTLKLIFKNLPFINKIYITCKDVQKLPNDTEDFIEEMSGRIVRVNESEFMPNAYVTFSASCIEMFIWKIPGLSEFFIYGNDDMIPLKKMSYENFFLDGNPVIRFFYYSNPFNCQYCLHIANANNLIFDRRKNDYDYTLCYFGEHTIRPLTKSICEKCYNEYKEFIDNSLYPVRYYKNFNIDMFLIYGLKNGFVINEDMGYDFHFSDVNYNLLLNYRKSIEEKKYSKVPHLMCINDCGDCTDEELNKIRSALKSLMKIDFDCDFENDITENDDDNKTTITPKNTTPTKSKIKLTKIHRLRK